MKTDITPATASGATKSGQSQATQLDRHYYYRRCQFDNGQTWKCAGFGAEDPAHLAVYGPHFAKGDADLYLLPGVAVLRGYHGDKLPVSYVAEHALQIIEPA